MATTRSALLVAAAISCASALAQQPAGSAPRVAIQGFDPVAYFTEGKALKGNPNLKVDWDDARYNFANARHRDLFTANPEHYAPQFAGYCTGNMSRGKRLEAHPEAWVILDGKLFLLGAKDSVAALKNKEMVEKDLPGFRVKVAAATGNWKATK